MVSITMLQSFHMPHLFKNAGMIVQLQGINISFDMRKHLVLILVSSYLLSKVHIGISVEMVIDRNSKVINLGTPL